MMTFSDKESVVKLVRQPISLGSVARRFEYKYSSVKVLTSLTLVGNDVMLDLDKFKSNRCRPSSLELSSLARARVEIKLY